MILILLVINIFLISVSECLKPPHIVIIIADDVGWNDFGFHGSNQIPTPNIDALAYNGMVLNRFYTLPTCTPSRSAFLTGYYPIRLGLQGVPISAGQDLHLPVDIPILPEKLKELGYATHLVGKWHLGASRKNFTPTMRGFDSHYGYWNGFISYFDHYAENDEHFEGLDLHKDLEPDWTKNGLYATDIFTEKAKQVIHDHDENKPLFLMVAHLAGHTGKHSKLEVPDIPKANNSFYYIDDANRRIYADIITSLDKSVGNIVSAIKDKGIIENTVIVFLSDNGAQTFGIHENFGSNWPLRGLKFTVLEGGVRNAAIVYSPLLKTKGVINNELFHISDLMPTLYTAAGGNASVLTNIDGIDQWKTIVDEKPTTRTELLINIDDENKSLGFISDNGRFKLVIGSSVLNETFGYHYGDSGRDVLHTIEYDILAVLNSDVNKAIEGNITENSVNHLRKQIDLAAICEPSLSNIVTPCNKDTVCLFDLFKDPCETENIASVYPNIVNRLKQRVSYFRKQAIPQKEFFIDPKSNPIYYNNTWITWLDAKFC